MSPRGAVTRADKSFVKSKTMTNQQPVEGLHKPIIKIFEK